ncbi:hypothetical protein EW026_g6780 [Hermanssonia centrifuga]|uniref:Conserved oligomeric Golgi complex subunit 7 n=1 Tax=Hermanssonia centrifuga TaxID=98765 RepID=A0A4S4K9Y5_9APHY|nr:hypothetical protein EW026_g6780 [Hermanssonia centrifuga]
MQAIAEGDDGSSSELVPLDSEDLLNSLEEHEDVVSWINEVLDPERLDSSASLTELDRRVVQMVGTLELASEDTSLQVERIIDDISRGASRLTYDLHFMREGASSLQAMLHGLEAKSKASVVADTNAALDRLHFLDTVKRNMETAREVLREAESWSTLESDVISLLGEQNYERAAERLSEASKSMVVFQNTPEYETRRTLMVSLQNQLEASLSSALVAAVNSQDVAVCRNYFSIFSNIQRESEFRNYYYGSRKAPLVEMWQNARLRDGDSGAESTAQRFSQFLPTFFAAFLSVLSTERTSIPAIFPDPQSTLSTLINSTLSSLQPTFSERLATIATYHGAKALPELIIAYKATQDFALGADRILEKIGYSTAPPSATTDGDGQQEKRLRRRSSARMSISRRIGPHRASISGNPLTSSSGAPLLGWDQELFEPFMEFQADYASLEKRYLTDALQEILDADVRSTAERARLLRERSVDVFSIADEAITRCMTLTHGYGSVGLAKSLDFLFNLFADSSKLDMSSRRTTVTSFSPSASGDLSDLNYTAEDWGDIQSLLHILEAVRALYDRILNFEGKLRMSLIQVLNTFRMARADPAGLHISGTTRGAIQLLTQSTLNSAELQELLDRVDPESHLQSQSRSGDSFLTVTSPTTDTRRSSHAFLLASTHPAPLLLEARAAISSFAKACQVALQDTILSPLRKRLASYSSLALWAAEADSKMRRGGGGSALNDVQVPTFSLSPSEVMQRVAEGLLELPRLFEVYADDDALSFSLETLPFINTEILKALSEPPSESVTSPVHPHSRRTSSLSLKTPPTLPQPSLPELTPEAVSAAWLSSLGLSLLTHLTAEVLPSIRTLSGDGAAQLASDLGYLSSIVMALNIEDPDLDKWKEYVEMDDDAGRQRVQEASDDDSVLATVAKLRGWISN